MLSPHDSPQTPPLSLLPPSQCIGASVGAAFIKSLSPQQFMDSGGAVNKQVLRRPRANCVGASLSPLQLAPPLPACRVHLEKEWVNLWTALGGEMLGTGLLVFTVCSAADVGRETNNKYTGGCAPPRPLPATLRPPPTRSAPAARRRADAPRHRPRRPLRAPLPHPRRQLLHQPRARLWLRGRLWDGRRVGKPLGGAAPPSPPLASACV